MHDGPTSPDERRLIFRLGDLLEGRLARVTLSVLVIASLLPLGTIDLMLRPVFVVCFGGDLLVRLLVWRADVHGTREVTIGSVAFAVVDALAFVSFFPLELWISDHDVLAILALLRLTRLFMLLRFGRGLVRDLYAIITRREQIQTLAFVSGAVAVLSLISAIILSQLATHVGNSEGPAPFLERFWWAFRQLESADNLVQTLDDKPVIVLLSVVLTVTGVFLVAFVIGIGTNVVDQLVRAERRRDLAYHGHTVIIGAVHEGEELIREFVRIYAKNRQVPSPERLWTWLRYMRPSGTRTFPRVALLARDDDMPGFLVEPIMRWVVYRQGDESEPESLQRVAAKRAKRAIFLAQRSLGLETDAVTISALAALRAENPACHAYVEVDDAESKDIVLQVGGANTVALDVPRFLGMFLCQHLLMPGVEGLYRDLLTSAGAEIYTHIFTDQGEHAAIARLPETVRFEDLIALGAQRGVQVLGVYLGPEPSRRNSLGVVEMAGLVRWLNPADEVRDPEIEALGAVSGVIPTRTLRGLIGIADTYLPLRAMAADLCNHPPAAAVPIDEEEVVSTSAALLVPPRGPMQVALVGASDSLPALLRELSLFVPGVDVLLCLSSRGGERTPLGTRLAALNVGIDADAPLPGIAGCTVDLLRGGRLTIHTHDGPDLARFAAERLRTRPPVEAAVFLCEAEGGDKDARTAMRVLRFIRLLEDGTIPHGDKLNVLAEFISVDKGTYLQKHVDVRKCGFATTDDLRLTLIAKETIKSYFMVHSSFVPGVSEIYDELLEERGQDMVRFGWQSGPGPVRWATIVEALRRRGAVAIAVERRGGAVITGLAADRVFEGDELAGVYAVAESAVLHD